MEIELGGIGEFKDGMLGVEGIDSRSNESVDKVPKI